MQLRKVSSEEAMTDDELLALAKKATPGEWSWQGEDYRGGWGWQLLVGPNGEGIACGQAKDGPYKHLRAFAPIEAKYCKTGFYADSESAPCLHIRENDAAWIIAANPAAIIALIERHRAEVERLTRERDEAREMHKTMCDLALYRANELQSAESALAAERKRCESAYAQLEAGDFAGALLTLRAALAGKEQNAGPSKT